jgi:hypothetical protein
MARQFFRTPPLHRDGLTKIHSQRNQQQPARRHHAIQEATLLAGLDSLCACNAILNRCQRFVLRGTLHGAMQGQHY